MPAIIDPALLDQLDQPDQAPAVDPNAPVPAGAAPVSLDDARPLTIRPGAATPQAVAAPTGPVTDPQLLKALNDAPDDQQTSSSPSTAMDLLKSAGTGLVRGAAAIPGMVGDISNFADQAPSWLGLKAADALGMLPPGETFDSAMKFANSPVNQVPPAAGSLGAAVQAVSPPTTQDILGNVQKVAGPLYQSQTPAGQMTQNVASFIPQATLAPGNLFRNALTYGVAPGVASEAAGQAANNMLGDWADPAARTVGAVLGGAAGHLIGAPTPAAALMSGATRGVSDADMAAAANLQQRAAAQGLQITPAEAIQHVTGGRSGLGNLQRHVEGMGESAPIMANYMAQRPGQVQQAASNVFGQIAPSPTDPFQTGVQAQNEAEGAMANIRQGRSNATSPYYQAAAGDEVPPARMAAVAQQLDALAAQNPNNPALTAPLSDLRRQIVATPAVPGQPAIPGQRVPVTDPNTGAVIRYNQTAGTPAVPPQPETYITNVGQLDKIYGGLRDQYTGPAPLGQSGTEARAGRIAGQGLGYLNDELTAASPSLAAGRQAHGIMTDRWVAPREAGPLGQITKTPDINAQGNSLYPSNPAVGSEGATADTIGRLPSTGAQITRNALETRFNEATQNLQPGPNQWGGAKFAAQAGGNQQQAANIAAGLLALPNGPQVASRYGDMVDAFRATGWRQQPGSKTAYNAHDIEGMGAGNPTIKAAALALSPVKAGEFVHDWYERSRIGANAELMANWLTDPEGMAQIANARAAVPPERYRSLMAQALLGRAAMTAPVAAQNRSASGQ